MQVLHADQLAYRMVAAGGRLRSQGVVVVQGMKSSAILVMRQAMKFAPAIKVPPQKLQAFCSRNHIRKLSLFGSVLTEKFHAGSDLDVLVEFEPGHVPGFFGIAGMQMELSEIFGRKVDLRTPEDLSRYFRSDVLASAAIQYERS